MLGEGLERFSVAMTLGITCTAINFVNDPENSAEDSWVELGAIRLQGHYPE